MPEIAKLAIMPKGGFPDLPNAAHAYLGNIEKLSRALVQLQGDASALPALGTAAAKDVGTAGDAIGLLNTANAWSGQQYFPIQTLTPDAGAIDWALNAKQVALVTLVQNSTLNNPTDMQPGGTYQLAVLSGGFTLSYGSMFEWPNQTVPVLDGDCLLTFLCLTSTRMWGVAVKDFG